MKNKEIIFWTVVIAFIGGIVLFVSLNKNQNTLDVKNTENVTNNTSATPTQTKPSPTPTQYLLSDVSKHSNQTSCWTIVDGTIYDITNFISSHPAGVQKILRGCGVDATSMYGRVGAHDVSRLTSFIVGTVK